MSRKLKVNPKRKSSDNNQNDLVAKLKPMNYEEPQINMIEVKEWDSETSCEEILVMMNDHVSHCTLIYQELAKEIKHMRSEVNNYKEHAEPEGPIEIDNTMTLLEIPKNSIEEFEELDLFLKLDYNKDMLINIFNTINVWNLGKFVRRCLKLVVTDHVACNYSWHGINKNIEVRSFNLIDIIRECAMAKFTHARIDDVDQFIKIWFQYAKDRQRKRKIEIEQIQN